MDHGIARHWIETLEKDNIHPLKKVRILFIIFITEVYRKFKIVIQILRSVCKYIDEICHK